VISAIIRIYLLSFYRYLETNSYYHSWGMWRGIFNAKKEALSFVYLLITEIHTYWSYGDSTAQPRLEKATAVR